MLQVVGESSREYADVPESTNRRRSTLAAGVYSFLLVYRGITVRSVEHWRIIQVENVIISSSVLTRSAQSVLLP